MYLLLFTSTIAFPPLCGTIQTNKLIIFTQKTIPHMSKTSFWECIRAKTPEMILHCTQILRNRDSASSQLSNLQTEKIIDQTDPIYTGDNSPHVRDIILGGHPDQNP